jgi:hypothetical protein
MCRSVSSDPSPSPPPPVQIPDSSAGVRAPAAFLRSDDDDTSEHTVSYPQRSRSHTLLRLAALPNAPDPNQSGHGDRSNHTHPRPPPVRAGTFVRHGRTGSFAVSLPSVRPFPRRGLLQAMIAEPQAAARTGGSPPPAGRGGSHCIAWSAAAGADAPPPARSDIPPRARPTLIFASRAQPATRARAAARRFINRQPPPFPAPASRSFSSSRCRARPHRADPRYATHTARP